MSADDVDEGLCHRARRQLLDASQILFVPAVPAETCAPFGQDLYALFVVCPGTPMKNGDIGRTRPLVLSASAVRPVPFDRAVAMCPSLFSEESWLLVTLVPAASALVVSLVLQERNRCPVADAWVEIC
jgi:hypothetical protein